MSTQQMTLSWTGTSPVPLAREKLILPLLTMNQCKFCKGNTHPSLLVLFSACFWAKKKLFCRVNCIVLQITSVIKMMSDTPGKRGPEKSSLPSAGVDQPHNDYFRLTGCRLVEHFNESMTV